MRGDFLAHEVGERHLGGGDQPAAVAVRLPRLSCNGRRAGRKVEVLGKLRQLTRSEHRLVANHQRHLHFLVAVLGGVQVEHELAERTLEPRKLALQNGEAAA